MGSIAWFGGEGKKNHGGHGGKNTEGTEGLGEAFIQPDMNYSRFQIDPFLTYVPAFLF